MNDVLQYIYYVKPICMIYKLINDIMNEIDMYLFNLPTLRLVIVV